jgi:hypothetical protein
MPVDATKIHQGPGHLWLDVAVPVSGSRLVIDTSGTPTSGTPVYGGAIDAATIVSIAAKMELVEADQISAPIDAIMTGEVAEIEATMKESDFAKLKHYLQHGTYNSDTDTGLPALAQDFEELTFGGIIPVAKTSVAVISPRRDNTAKFLVSQLYSAVQIEAIKLPFTRKKETMYGVKFTALAVTTRAVGDQCGKIYRQT